MKFKTYLLKLNYKKNRIVYENVHDFIVFPTNYYQKTNYISIEDNMQDSVSVGAEGTVPEKMKDEAKDMFGANAVTEVSAEKPAEKTKVAPAPKQKVVNMEKKNLLNQIIRLKTSQKTDV